MPTDAAVASAKAVRETFHVIPYLFDQTADLATIIDTAGVAALTARCDNSEAFYAAAIRRLEELTAERDALREACQAAKKSIGAPIAHFLTQETYRLLDAALSKGTP